MLSSGKFPLKKQELFSAVSAGSEELIRVLVKYWPDLEGKAYTSLFLHLLKHKKLSAETARIMLERKMIPPSDPAFEKLLKDASEPELEELFQIGKKAEAPASENSPASEVTTEKETPFEKELPTRVGRTIFNKRLRDQVWNAVNGRQYPVLERFLLRDVHPDSIVQKMTLLQHAVRMDDRKMFDLLLKHGAYLYTRSPECEWYPVSLSVRENAALFKILVRRQDMPFKVHQQLMSVILESSNDAALREYLSLHGKRLKSSPQCFLTLALKKRSSEKILIRLMAFYRDFSDPKHHSVIQQALAGDYRPAVINTLILRKARTDVKAAVVIGAKTFHLTPLETARKVRSSSLIRALLRKAGAK